MFYDSFTLTLRARSIPRTLQRLKKTFGILKGQPLVITGRKEGGPGPLETSQSLLLVSAVVQSFLSQKYGSLVMSPFFTSPNHDRYFWSTRWLLFQVMSDVQYSQVMGRFPCKKPPKRLVCHHENQMVKSSHGNHPVKHPRNNMRNESMGIIIDRQDGKWVKMA